MSTARASVAMRACLCALPLSLFMGVYAPLIAAFLICVVFVVNARSVPRDAALAVTGFAIIMVLSAIRSPERFWWALFGDMFEPTTVLGLLSIAFAFIIGGQMRDELPNQHRVLNVILICVAGSYAWAYAMGGSLFGTPIDTDAASGFLVAASVGALAFFRERLLFPRVLGVLSGMLCLVLACVLFAGSREYPQDKVAGYADSYAIASGLWASNQHSVLFGIGPRAFADAWHAHRPPSTLTARLWDAEPAASRSALLTVGVEYGAVAAWALMTSMLVASAWAASSGRWTAGVAWVTALVLLAASSPSLVACISWALLLGAIGIRGQQRASVVMAEAVRSVAVVVAALCVWFATALLLAHMHLSRDPLVALPFADFVKRMDVFPGISAPFAAIDDMRIALWRAHIAARMQKGEPIVFEEGGRQDLFAFVFAELDVATRSRPGFRSTLLAAQIALWSAERGYPDYLWPAQSYLVTLLEYAPLHVTARLLQSRIESLLGLTAQAERDFMIADRLYPKRGRE